MERLSDQQAQPVASTGKSHVENKPNLLPSVAAGCSGPNGKEGVDQLGCLRHAVWRRRAHFPAKRVRAYPRGQVAEMSRARTPRRIVIAYIRKQRTGRAESPFEIVL